MISRRPMSMYCMWENNIILKFCQERQNIPPAELTLIFFFYNQKHEKMSFCMLNTFTVADEHTPKAALSLTSILENSTVWTTNSWNGKGGMSKMNMSMKKKCRSCSYCLHNCIIIVFFLFSESHKIEGGNHGYALFHAMLQFGLFLQLSNTWPFFTRINLICDLKK